MENLIEVTDVRKLYRGGAEALRGVTLNARLGEITCLVGPNGAGKTTLVRIIGTQLIHTSGTLTVLGMDVVKQVARVRKHLGVVPQEASPDPDLTTFEQVYFYLRARGVGYKAARESADCAIAHMGMCKERDQKASILSGGLRRRILIAMAISTGAKVLLLDEPTTGLDPVSRRETWDLLIGLKATRILFLTTHSMEEAEAIADRVAVMKDGTIIANGSVPELKNRLPTRDKLYFANGVDRQKLQSFGTVESYGGRLVLYPVNRDAIEKVIQMSLGRYEVSIVPTSLEDVYVNLLKDQELVS